MGMVSVSGKQANSRQLGRHSISAANALSRAGLSPRRCVQATTQRLMNRSDSESPGQRFSGTTSNATVERMSESIGIGGGGGGPQLSGTANVIRRGSPE